MKKIKFIIVTITDGDGKRIIRVCQHQKSYQAALYLNYTVISSDRKKDPNNLDMGKLDVDGITVLDD